MYFHNLDPVLIKLGFLEIRYYGLVYLFGFLLTLFVLKKYRKELDIENEKAYDKLCRSVFGKAAYPAILEFIKEAKKYIPRVEASVVDRPGINKAACKKIVAKLGVHFRLRPYYEEKYVR